MPELTFVSRWPDGRTLASYSPSLVVHDFLVTGRAYEVSDYLDRTRQAMRIASHRVEAKYGTPCVAAAATTASIEQAVRRCPTGQVVVESITPGPSGDR